MNRLLVSWFSVGLMLILFQSLAECSLSKNVTLKEGQTFNLECSSGNRSDWWITYNGTRIQVAACIAHISKCIYQIISDNDNYRASYYKPNGYVSDSNTTSTTSYFQVLHVQHGLTKIECSNDVSSVSWDVTVVGVTLTVNGETSDVVSTCDSTTVTVSCQYEGQSKSTLSLLWRSFNDEMIVLAGTLGNKLTYTLPQEFTARHYSLFTNWIECSLRGAVDVTTKVRLVIDACYEPPTKAQPFGKKEGIVVGVSIGGSSFLFVMVVILTLYCTRAHRIARRESSGRRHSSLRSQPHISLTLDTVHASDPPEYTEVFSEVDFSTAPPPPDYYSLPPSYDNVAHFYKHSGGCVIEYISDQSLDQSTDQSIDQLPHQTTNQTIDQNTNQPLEQSTDQSMYQSSHHSSDQSTDQTSNQSTDQTSNQSTDQSIHPSAE